jgi:anti-anti-sigma factor
MRLQGELTFRDNTEFRKLIDEVFSQEVGEVTIDLAKTTLVDSAGLAMFVILQKRAKERGATVALQQANAQISRVLELVDFGKLFTIRN